jgi:hypothetical protein
MLDIDSKSVYLCPQDRSLHPAVSKYEAFLRGRGSGGLGEVRLIPNSQISASD